jgi:hypothetical protein
MDKQATNVKSNILVRIMILMSPIKSSNGRTNDGTYVTFPLVFLAILSHTRLRKDTQVKME